MTDQDEAGAADAGAQDIRSAVAAAVNEREARTACGARRPCGGRKTRVTAEAGTEFKLADGKDEDTSQHAAGAAQSQPDNSLTPPGRWSASQKEMFKSLPDVAQRFLIERHQAMEADHHRKTQAIANIRRDHEAIGATVCAVPRGDAGARDYATPSDRILGRHGAPAGAGRWDRRH